MQKTIPLKKIMFKTPYNSLDVKPKGETFDKKKYPSLTVPDETMTIKEILVRYAKGLSISQGKVPMYATDDNDDENLEHVAGVPMQALDFSEKQALANEAKETINTYKKAHNDAKSKKERKALEDQIRADLEKERKEQEAQQEQQK